MSLTAAQHSLIVQAPASVCCSLFFDALQYGRWEPSVISATLLEQSADAQLLRVQFEVQKRILFLNYRLRYSVRCQKFAWSDRLWIKFDQAEGDVRTLMTVAEFEPLAPDRCRMSYRTAVDEPFLLKRAVVAFFGPAELRSHLERFKVWVEAYEQPLIRQQSLH